jgi:hypothetical protein
MFHVRIPQCQIDWLKVEAQRPPLARRERHALEALELDHRPGD